MLCRNPYQKGMQLFPCGQCMPCRFNRRRIWTHRLLLEATRYSENTFLSLTYRDDNLPFTSNGLPTLNPKHLQDWLKRFRAEISPLRIRFYACGEYGDETERPHYHVAIFGFPTCERITTSYGYTKNDDYARPTCCEICLRYHDTWGHGRIFAGDLTEHSSQYIAGYVTKKMTAKDDKRLAGRHPEFARMSNRPGIGAHFMDDVASSFLEFDLEQSEADVPSVLNHGTRKLPLGRYLRDRLRERIGREKGTPQAIKDALALEMLPMWEAAQAASSNPTTRSLIFKQMVQDLDHQKVASAEARQRIFKKKGNL